MLNVPETVKTLFKADGIRKNFRAHFPNGELPDITNDDIVQESVKFTESLCSQDVLKFGLTEASVLEFETVGVANMYGMTIEAGIEIDLSSLSAADLADIAAGTWDGTYVAEADSDLGYGFFRVPYGVFRVESCPRDHQAMAHRRVTGYMYIDPAKPLSKFFSRVLLYESYTANDFVLLETVGLAKTGDMSYYPTDIDGWFYNSSGQRIKIFSGNGQWYVNILGPTLRSFTSYDFDADLDAYESNGVKISEALTSAGIDLTYGKDGTHIYKSNEDALRKRMPFLFSPCDMTSISTYSGDTEIKRGYLDGASFPFESGELIPDSFFGLQRVQSETEFRSGRTGGIFERYQGPTTITYQVNGVNTSITVNTADCGLQLKGGSLYVPVSGGPYNYFSVPVNSTLKIENAFWVYHVKNPTNDNELDDFQLNGYSFTNAISFNGLVEGNLELHAKFGKTDRSGGFAIMQLSDSNPVAVSPGFYENFWWDEYDVLPIGTVNYTFENRESESGSDEGAASYQFGDGESIYDMTDNEILKSLSDVTAEDIEAMLDETFIPNLGPIAFTPIDLTMKGLPYLEAGDYLAITAEDGTVANSFAMRQEISGVQVLTASIESTSGDIIESEEGE